MPDMMTTALILVGAAVLVLCVLLLFRYQHRRSLRQRFGPEYDHTLEAAGDRRAAERELEHRLDHMKQVKLRDLDPRERRDLASRWRGIQVDFVDHPEDAVETADRLVTEAMRLRGYPDGDFDQRLADASVTHPHLAADYRDARRIAEANRRRSANTEDLRRAMVCYRSIFQALLGIDEVGPDTTTAPARQQVRRCGVRTGRASPSNAARSSRRRRGAATCRRASRSATAARRPTRRARGRRSRCGRRRPARRSRASASTHR